MLPPPAPRPNARPGSTKARASTQTRLPSMAATLSPNAIDVIAAAVYWPMPMQTPECPILFTAGIHPSTVSPNPAIAAEGRSRRRGRGRTSSVDDDHGHGNTSRRLSRLGARLDHGKPCYSKDLCCFVSLVAGLGRHVGLPAQCVSPDAGTPSARHCLSFKN